MKESSSTRRVRGLAQQEPKEGQSSRNVQEDRPPTTPRIVSSADLALWQRNLAVSSNPRD